MTSRRVWIANLLPCACLFSGSKALAQTAKKAKTEVMTGVVDEVESEYVLTGEDRLRPKAILRAEGFTADNFARFVGLRVEIKGQAITENGKSILVVRRLGDIQPKDETAPK